MGGKKSKAAPAPVPTPQVATPDVDVATLAAEKALAAQGDVRATQDYEEEERRGRRGQLGQTQQPPRPRPERDPAAIANVPAGSMSSSAIITG